jgi:hypothetical protein
LLNYKINCILRNIPILQKFELNKKAAAGWMDGSKSGLIDFLLQ